MTKKHVKALFISAFSILCVCLIIVELMALSSILTDSLLFFYFLLPITILLFIVSIVKLVNIIQYVKLDIDYYEKYNRIGKTTNKIISALIFLSLILTSCYSAYQRYVTNQYSDEFYAVFNSSNFTDYKETEKTQYNVAFVDTTSLFGSSDTTITKMAFIDDTKHQIIIDGTHIKTKSTMLKNLKYHLMKSNLMKDKDYVEKDDCIYFFDEGIYDGIIRYSEIIVVAKGKSGFVCITVQTSTPDVPINVERTLKYCNELVG